MQNRPNLTLNKGGVRYQREGCGVTPACQMCWQVLVFRVTRGRQTAGSSRVTSLTVLVQERKNVLSRGRFTTPAAKLRYFVFFLFFPCQTVVVERFSFEKRIQYQNVSNFFSQTSSNSSAHLHPPILCLCYFNGLSLNRLFPCNRLSLCEAGHLRIP